MTLPPGARDVPALPGHWIFGSLTELQDDYLGTLLRASRALGPIVRIHAGPPGWRETLYSVSSPELAAEVLGDPDRFSKDEPGYRQIRQALGNGMLTSEGAVWRRQRRMLAPIFTPRRIARSYVSIMVDEAQQLAGRWRSAASDSPTVDVSADMLELASRTIGRILYGSDMATALPQVMRFDYINEEMLRRSVSRHPMPMWVPTPANRKLKDGLRVLRQLVSDIIAARRAQGDEGATDDMLGLLLTARDVEEDSGPLTDEEVIDQVLVFMLAGHDTTSTTLACSLVELARHPGWQQKVQQELQQVLGDRPPSAHDVAHLPWTGRVAREAMRLYPASHSTGRSPIGDQVVGGYLLPAGSTVVVSTYALHRSPDSWDRPDEFDPGRYDVPDGVLAGGHKHAWMAFGSGPHTCVGMTLATQMVTVVLATLLQQVELTTALTSVPVHASMTLRPAGALPVEVGRSVRLDQKPTTGWAS